LQSSFPPFLALAAPLAFSFICTCRPPFPLCFSTLAAPLSF
jgi:hypothetical protein